MNKEIKGRLGVNKGRKGKRRKREKAENWRKTSQGRKRRNIEKNEKVKK